MVFPAKWDVSEAVDYLFEFHKKMKMFIDK